VVNYSWNNAKPGGFDSIAQAAQGLIQSGVTLVNSAGNNNLDAAGYTPTYLPEVISVGATDIVDRRSTWTYPGSTTVYASNYGSAVDLFAPGIGVKVASIGSNNAAEVMYGTSFAAPHVTGAAALYLQINPFATPAQVQSYIVNRAAPGKVRNVPSGTTQSLLYVY
jgi:subtilisin family serine protease